MAQVNGIYSYERISDTAMERVMEQMHQKNHEDLTSKHVDDDYGPDDTDNSISQKVKIPEYRKLEHRGKPGVNGYGRSR